MKQFLNIFISSVVIVICTVMLILITTGFTRSNESRIVILEKQYKELVQKQQAQEQTMIIIERLSYVLRETESDCEDLSNALKETIRQNQLLRYELQKGNHLHKGDKNVRS